MLPIEFPFQLFTGLDGLPLNSGYVYFGQPNQNPITSPVTVYWDAAGTQPALQPLRTENGYIVRSGTPANVFFDGAYSELVKDKNGAQVFYARTSIDFSVISYVVAYVAALTASLASSIGASLIGFIQSGAGAILRTVQAKLRDQVHISDFGVLGTADDAAIWQLAIDSGHRTIDARGVTSTILTQVNLASNQTILFSGASVTTGGTSLKTFSAVTKSKVNLVGPLLITGDLVANPGLLVTSCGIYIEDCAKTRVSDITVLNVKGYGVRNEPGASASARGDHGYFNNIRVDSCVWGWKDSPGSGAEYCTVTNMHVTGCADAGIETAAGNTLFVGGHCVDNLKDGFRAFGGANNTHGIVTGMNINHNAQYNVYTQDVTNGMEFNGCHVYANGSGGQGAMYFKNSKGVVMRGGTRDCWTYNDSGADSGLNYLLDQYCPGDYGDSKLLSTNGAEDQLVAMRNFGPGNYTAGITNNTPSRVFLNVTRAAATLQTLTTATPTVLNFPTNNSDRRETFSATSVFTVPAGEAGWYQISGTQHFTATTINTAASSLEVQKNGAALRGKRSSALFGAGSIDFSHDSGAVLLAAGDTIRLVATVTGTGTVQHGDATYPCYMTIERIDAR